MIYKLHADEIDIDDSLAHRLIASQFPQWKDLLLEQIQSGGSSNVIYRLGEDMAVRIPRLQRVAEKIKKEQLWLPRLTSHLPLTIPTPLAKGIPDEGYPWDWSIYQWITGEPATTGQVDDMKQAANDLGEFVAALAKIDSTDGPTPGKHNSSRGESLKNRDADVHDAIEELNDIVDTKKALNVWEKILKTPEWHNPPVWIHGDLHADNLLAKNGKLHAVIDFGCLAVGDPACDIMVAWTYLTKHTRDAFRQTVAIDDATWIRGMGWALSFGLIALPYYQKSNPVLAAIARRSIDQVLSDNK